MHPQFYCPPRLHYLVHHLILFPHLPYPTRVPLHSLRQHRLMLLRPLCHPRASQLTVVTALRQYHLQLMHPQVMQHLSHRQQVQMVATRLSVGDREFVCFLLFGQITRT